MEKIYLFKLISGEEMIARIIADHEHVFVVKQPVTITYHQVDDRITGGFAPFMPYGGEDNIRIYKTSVAAMSMTPQQRIVDEYIRATTGIQIAPANSLA